VVLLSTIKCQYWAKIPYQIMSFGEILRITLLASIYGTWALDVQLTPCGLGRLEFGCSPFLVFIILQQMAFFSNSSF
jgi:hypothetical protein